MNQENKNIKKIFKIGPELTTSQEESEYEAGGKTSKNNLYNQLLKNKSKPAAKSNLRR